MRIHPAAGAIGIFFLGCGFAYLDSVRGPRPSPIDKAQATFEQRERPKGYDFDAWRRTDDLKCQNVPTLRICRGTPIITTEYGVIRDFVTFACSTTECAWVDP